MSDDQDFSNREILTMFDHIKGELVAIKEQTIKTNGRVTKLETWQTIIKATFATLTSIGAVMWAGITFIFK